MRGFWTCQRQTGGVVCKATNPNRLQKCQRCSKRRPPKKPPLHMSTLELPYSYFVEANGGDHCGICYVAPKPGKKLNRDHSHEGVGFARGVLCWRHNQALEMFGDDPNLLQAAIDYLNRAEARRPR